MDYYLMIMDLTIQLFDYCLIIIYPNDFDPAMAPRQRRRLARRLARGLALGAPDVCGLVALELRRYGAAVVFFFGEAKVSFMIDTSHKYYNVYIYYIVFCLYLSDYRCMMMYVIDASIYIYISRCMMHLCIYI